ncbi:MAG: nitroreductase family protein [Defluviitaleaceae bacterium]|nr:nitroreductase family protein [Defluviitaleaceae bacterium]MCL2239488.1 nitroreductase family protein [Defluviitaleaceae bacterium]
MNFFDTIHARYSHKEDFLPDLVPLADLKKIALAGLAAPNGANRQLVRLVMLPDRAALEPLGAVVAHGGLHTAPAAIAVLTTDGTPSGVMCFEKEDYAAATTQMLLAAVALGYASLWLDSPFFDAEREKRAKEILGAPEQYRLWALLPVGKPKGPGSRREKMPVGERLFTGRYGITPPPGDSRPARQ